MAGASEYTIINNGQETKIYADDVSDGHHTISELYHHRHALFAALVKIYDGYITPLGATAIKCWKSKLHNDGTMFDGWFIVGMTRKNIDMSEMNITYHLPMSWWDHFDCIEIPRAPVWDGHTSKDVINRLMKL